MKYNIYTLSDSGRIISDEVTVKDISDAELIAKTLLQNRSYVVTEAA